MNKILLMMLLSLGTQAQIKDTTTLDKLKQESDTVLIITVLQSTLEEFNMVLDFITQSDTSEIINNNNQEIVLFHNVSRDSVLVRFVNETGSDETYKLFVK
tara:strand:+ start:1117 stop:1419 length:303 start_codon:yes stop_codon:yes gene_type:complete